VKTDLVSGGNGVRTGGLTVSVWSTVKILIDQTQLVMSTTVNGGASDTQSVALSTPIQTTWQNVYVWAARWSSATAKIRNLVISPPSSLPVSYYPVATYPTGVTLSKWNLVGIVSLPARFGTSISSTIATNNKLGLLRTSNALPTLSLLPTNLRSRHTQKK
jgi:hypothetical protein